MDLFRKASQMTQSSSSIFFAKKKSTTASGAVNGKRGLPDG